MAAVREQVAGLTTGTGPGSRTSTFTTNPPAGSKVLVAVWVQTATLPSSVTDNAGNTYVLDQSGTGNPGDATLDVRIYRADYVALPASGTLAVTVNMPDYGSHQAIAYTGVAAGGPNSGTQNLSSTGVTGGNSGAAGDASSALHFAVFTLNSGNASTGIATTSPFVQQGAEQNGSSFLAGACSDQINALASQTCNWTWTGGSFLYTAAIVAYAASATGPVEYARSSPGLFRGPGRNMPQPWNGSAPAQGVTYSVLLSAASAASFGTGAYTTAAFTPAVDTRLAVIEHAQHNLGNTDPTPDFTLTDSQGLTWTRLAAVGNASSWSMGLAAWISSPVTSAVPTTLTFDAGTRNIYAYDFVVLGVRGASGTAAGVVTNGATATDGAYNVTLGATPSPNDLVIFARGLDTSGSSTLSMASDWSVLANVAESASDLLLAVAARRDSTSTTVSVSDTNTSGVSAFKGIDLAFILPAAGVAPTQNADVALVATATLSADGTNELQGAVSLPATATLTAPATLNEVAAVNLPATATLSAQPAPIAGAVSLTTSQSLTADGLVSKPGAATLTATATLTAAATLIASASVSLASTATLSATGTLTAQAAVSLSAAATLSLGIVETEFASVSLSAGASLTAAAKLTEFAAVSLSAVPTLTAAATLTAFGAVSLVVGKTLTVDVGAVGGSVNLTTAQSLVAGAALNEFAATSLTATGVLSVSGLRTTFGSVTLSAVPVLTSAVSVRITQGTTSLAALSTLSVGGIAILNVSVPLVATGGLNVNGTTGSGGGTNLGMVCTLSVNGIRTVFGAAQLNALSNLSLNAFLTELAAVALGASGALSVNGTVIKLGTVALTASAALVLQPAVVQFGSVALVVLPVFQYVELFPTVVFGPVGNWSVGGIHPNSRQPQQSVTSGWSTGGIHVGSVR